MCLCSVGMGRLTRLPGKEICGCTNAGGKLVVKQVLQSNSQIVLECSCCVQGPQHNLQRELQDFLVWPQAIATVTGAHACVVCVAAQAAADKVPLV